MDKDDRASVIYAGSLVIMAAGLIAGYPLNPGDAVMASGQALRASEAEAAVETGKVP